MPISPTFISVFKQLLPDPTILSATNRAAVALILRPSTSSLPLDVLLIQRSPRSSDPWSAHIALPGGRRDPCDSDDFSTVVREVHEETALDLLSSRYAFLGRLNDRPIRRATRKEGVLCTFVFLQLDLADRIIPQPEEVASSFWIPLCELHNRSPLFCTHSIYVPYHGHTVFAATVSAIRRIFGLSNLRMPALDVLRHGKDVVKAIEAPHAVLWGMTLDVLGDLIENLGLRRIDRPAVLPDSIILAGLLHSLAQVEWLIKNFMFWRHSKLDFLRSAQIT